MRSGSGERFLGSIEMAGRIVGCHGPSTAQPPSRGANGGRMSAAPVGLTEFGGRGLA